MVPIPTFPFESITKAVEVEFALELEMRKNGVVPWERPSSESSACGEVEAPRPRLPALEKIRAVVVAALPEVVAITKSGEVLGAVGSPAMESVAQGVEVERPRKRLVVSRERKLAEESVVAAE